MAIHTVGAGGSYASISDAVAASSSGDTIDVAAGTYVNDFPTIRHDLILNAVGGTVNLVATVSPPNGKAIVTEGAPGIHVAISGFDISGAQVPDGNGAAIRYEGGTLSLAGVTIHHNQNGLLANDDPGGAITIAGSAFLHNGSGTGYTHGIYVNRIGALTIDGTTVTGTAVGHQVKSRAAATTVTNSFLGDGTDGTGSYIVDLPNGGAAVIAANVLQKGPAAQNSIAISFGEEGNLHPGSSLTVKGNTVVNDLSGFSTAVRNTTGAVAEVSGNSFHGWTALTDGPASLAGNILAAIRPDLALPAAPPAAAQPDPAPAAPAPAAPQQPAPTPPDAVTVQPPVHDAAPTLPPQPLPEPPPPSLPIEEAVRDLVPAWPPAGPSPLPVEYPSGGHGWTAPAGTSPSGSPVFSAAGALPHDLLTGRGIPL